MASFVAPKASAEQKPQSTAEVKTPGETLFCGRKIARCDCISTKTFYIALLSLGIAFLIIGCLGILGHMLPSLEPLNGALQFFAFQLGTDPMVLICFATAFGIGLSVTGGGGLIASKFSQTTKTLDDERPLLIA